MINNVQDDVEQCDEQSFVDETSSKVSEQQSSSHNFALPLKRLAFLFPNVCHHVPLRAQETRVLTRLDLIDEGMVAAAKEMAICGSNPPSKV